MELDKNALDRHITGNWGEDQFTASNKLLDEYKELGREAGRNSGSWAYDGNTDISWYQKVYDGYQEGDPVVMDMMPSCLSGEMEGESMIEILGDYADDEDVQDAYEQGFEEGWWDTVISACMYQLDIEPGT